MILTFVSFLFRAMFNQDGTAREFKVWSQHAHSFMVLVSKEICKACLGLFFYRK